MEKDLRIVYSAVFFCSFNMLKHVVLIDCPRRDKIKAARGELDRGYRPGQI
jgi:hypothetical protein